MPSGLTVSSTNNVPQTFQPMIAATKRAIENNPVMSDKVDQYTITPGHSSVRQPYIGPLSAGKLQEGVAYAVPTTPNITTRTLTADEYGVMSIIPRIAEHRSTAGLKAKLGMAHGDAIARLVDEGGLGLFAGLTKSYGSTTTELNYKMLVQAATSVRRKRSPHYGGKPPEQSVVAILEPGVIDALLFNSVSTGGNTVTGGVFSEAVPAGISEQFMKQWYRGHVKLSNVMVYEGRNIVVTDASSVGSATGAVFAKSAFGFAREMAVMNNSQMDIRLRSTLLESHGHWGWTELIDSWGAKIISSCQEFDAITTIS